MSDIQHLRRGEEGEERGGEGGNNEEESVENVMERENPEETISRSGERAEDPGRKGRFSRGVCASNRGVGCPQSAVAQQSATAACGSRRPPMILSLCCRERSNCCPV